MYVSELPEEGAAGIPSELDERRRGDWTRLHND